MLLFAHRILEFWRLFVLEADILTNTIGAYLHWKQTYAQILLSTEWTVRIKKINEGPDQPPWFGAPRG